MFRFQVFCSSCICRSCHSACTFSGMELHFVPLSNQLASNSHIVVYSLFCVANIPAGQYFDITSRLPGGKRVL